MDLAPVSPITNTTATHRLLEMVPDEIWVKIFMASINGKACVNPFLLSAVCAHWRRIALANAVIWGTVSIPLLTIYGDENESPEALKYRGLFQARVDALKVWIGRAGTRTLTITVGTWCTLPPESEVGQQVPRIIVAHASQIVSLSMRIYDKWRPFFRGVEFPQLRALCLDPYPQPPNDSLLDFSRSSHLSTVAVHGIFESVGILLPWSQIVDVDFSRINTGDCFTAMDLLPNLQRCSFELRYRSRGDVNIGWEREIQRRESPSLTFLGLYAARPSDMRIILDSLPLTLQELRLDKPNYLCGDNDRAALFKSIPPFAGTLRSLALYLIPPDLATFPDLLQLLPGLETLDTTSIRCKIGFDNHLFLHCFARTGVVPRLLNLAVKGIGDELDDETLLTVLRYRRHLTGGADCVKIQDVQFQVRSSSRDVASMDPAMKAMLEEMIEDGLNVSVTPAPERWADFLLLDETMD